MAAKSSTAPAFIWNWVVETLANSEQADVSTLTRLVKIAPVISGDAGNNGREVVCLRILEKLFDHGNESTIDVDSAKNCKISFDASERCEDVLKQILQKTPEQMTKVEKEKWDVHPFLMHKKSLLSKCSLKKLKEGIHESSHTLFASLKEKSNIVNANGPEDISHEIQQNKFKEANLPQGTYAEGNDKGVLVDIMESLKLAKSKERESIIIQLNKERADDERNDTALKKEVFLNSRCTLDQDSFAMTELSEIDHCMKCNESGKLLVCGSDTCPLRVHETCLGSVFTLDEIGEFFCPFCKYSRAISKYLEAKKKVSLARKDLQAFTSFTKRSINKSSMEQSEIDKNLDIQMGDNNINCMSNEEDFNIDPSLKQSDDLSQNPTPKPSTRKQECKEKESPRSTESSCSRILRKRKAQYVHAPTPVFPLRRKVLPWIKLEEEILKEGVERYSSAIYKGIPWKEILYFGRNVFHKSRTTIDLKDKWRNMCKGSPSEE